MYLVNDLKTGAADITLLGLGQARKWREKHTSTSLLDVSAPRITALPSAATVQTHAAALQATASHATQGSAAAAQRSRPATTASALAGGPGGVAAAANTPVLQGIASRCETGSMRSYGRVAAFSGALADSGAMTAALKVRTCCGTLPARRRS